MKNKANKIKKQLKKITFENLKDYACKLGFAVLFYESEDGKAELARYSLEEVAKNKKAFTYIANAKFIFLSSQLSAEEKLHVLSHEIGHIVLGHVGCNKVIDAYDAEMHAEVFTYYLLYAPKEYRIRPTCAILLLVATLSVFVTYKNSNHHQKDSYVPAASYSYSDTQSVDNQDVYYYVTPTGRCYHTPDCTYIVNNCNSTSISAVLAQKRYTPCKVCKP